MEKLQRTLLTVMLALAASILAVSCREDASQGTDRFSSLDDLYGHKVGVMMGSKNDIEMTRNMPGLELLRYNNPALVLQALDLGKVETAILDTVVTFNADLEGRGMEICFSGFDGGDAGMGFRYDETQLCGEFNRFLASIKEDGTYDEILHRWTDNGVDGVVIPEIPIKDDAEPLEIGIIGGNMPFAFVTEKGFAGVEPELLTRFASAIGRKPVFHEYEFTALTAGLQSGRVDIISAFLFKTEERSKTILFSDSYYYCACVCIAKTGQSLKEDSFWNRFKKLFHANLIAEDRYKLILEGLETTLIISFFAILLGTILGAFMAWRAMSKRKKLWHGILKGYGAIMHGVPLLVILMIMFYVVFASTSVSAIWVSIITFAIYFGYASCEIFLSGVSGVGKGQSEAAWSLGFTKFGAFRYVIWPQAVKRILPFYEGEAVTLIKETSLVGFIAVVDLTKASDIIQGRTFNALFPLITVSILYFLIAWLLGEGLKKLTAKKA